MAKLAKFTKSPWRVAREVLLNPRYRVVGDRLRCVYCGAPREHDDHVPALYWAEKFSVDEWSARGVSHVLVACCWDCNRALGVQPLHTVRERAAWLLQRREREVREALDLLRLFDGADAATRFYLNVASARSDVERNLVCARARVAGMSALWRVESGK